MNNTKVYTAQEMREASVSPTYVGGVSEVRVKPEVYEMLEQAAARLRNVTVRTDNSAVIAELQRRLKVAEDALEMCKNAMCSYCRATPEAKGLPCLNGCETLAVAKNALAAIREEGGAKC